MGISSCGCDDERVVLDTNAPIVEDIYTGNWIYIFAAGGETSLHRIVAYNGDDRAAWLEPADGSGASAGTTWLLPGPMSMYVVLATPARPEGVRLAVGGDLLVDAWLHFFSPVGGSPSAAIWLSGGNPADLALEYRSLAGAGSIVGGGAKVVLEWSSLKATGGSFQSVSSERLYFNPSTLAFPLTLF